MTISDLIEKDKILFDHFHEVDMRLIENREIFPKDRTALDSAIIMATCPCPKSLSLPGHMKYLNR